MKIYINKRILHQEGHCYLLFDVSSRDDCCSDMAYQYGELLFLHSEAFEDKNEDSIRLTIKKHESDYSYGDYSEIDYFIPIQICPFCGEPVEIVVLSETNITAQYNELLDKNKELVRRINETDSKKEERTLCDLRQQIQTEINMVWEGRE